MSANIVASTWLVSMLRNIMIKQSLTITPSLRKGIYIILKILISVEGYLFKINSQEKVQQSFQGEKAIGCKFPDLVITLLHLALVLLENVHVVLDILEYSLLVQVLRDIDTALENIVELR